MLIDELPDVMKPLTQPIRFMGPEIRDGMPACRFHHDSLDFVVRGTPGAWTVHLGASTWALPRRHPETPDGFQADLARVFGITALQHLQFLYDSITWHLLQQAHVSWHLQQKDGSWVATYMSGDVPGPGNDFVHQCRLPMVLDTLKNDTAHIMHAYQEPTLGRVGLEYLDTFFGVMPTTGHARIALGERVHAHAVRLNRPHWLEQLGAAP